MKEIGIKTIEEVMHESMIPYSEYVILDRALPRVEDGLKPVQRRILYAMHDMGLTPDKPYRKSAGIVGECLGKYHPHGDTSVYDAMVRMAQPFNMRMTLIDGHGNFGSVDGDSAAAMRYTEARLTPLAMEVLRDIEKETVSWSLNFDDRLKEPDVLPCRFPNLLVNGANGIAVGLATNIPTHNLGEVIDGAIMLIDNPCVSLEELMTVIKGPDFPTGAFVSGGQELIDAYATGVGKLTMRAKSSIEDDGRSIVVTELPYQVNKALLQQKMADLREEKKIDDITDIVDESDRTGTRVVIKLRKGANATRIRDILYKYTDLQKTFGVNMVAIADGKPQQLGLIAILNYYVNYQRQIIINRTTFDLKAARERAHIVEGLVIAVANIDEVVAIIKKSANVGEARDNLRARFLLSEIQAQAVLDMKLARLTSLEIEKLQKELAELKKKIAEYEAILASRRRQMSIVKAELDDIKKRFTTPRLTTVMYDFDKSTLDDVVIEEGREGVVIGNYNGRFKFLTPKAYAMATTAAKDCSEQELAPIAVNTVTDHTLYAFTNLGNCHKIPVSSIPEKKWKEKGATFYELSKNAVDNEKIVAVFDVGKNVPTGNLMFYTKHGMLKKTPWSEYEVAKSSFAAMTLREGDELLGVENEEEGTNIMICSKNGFGLLVTAEDLQIQTSRVTSGVKSINLNDGDEISAIFQMDTEGELVTLTSGGYIRKVLAATFEPMHRNRMGIKILTLDADVGKNVAMYSYVREPYEIAVVLDGGNIISIDTEDIEISNKRNKGKQIFKGKHKIKAAFKHYSRIKL